jgi:hypothetical protein
VSLQWPGSDGEHGEEEGWVEDNPPVPGINRLGRQPVSQRDQAPLTTALGAVERRLSSVEDHLLRLENTIAQVDLKLGARFDELEAVMAEPLPVDVSGILHALEAKLFVPLDEMADSLADSKAANAGKTLSDVADRLERLEGTCQHQLLERLDNLTQQVDVLRRRIALRARPGTPEVGAETIVAIADAVATRLDEGRSGSMGLQPSLPASEGGPDDIDLRTPAGGSPRKIRLR